MKKKTYLKLAEYQTEQAKQHLNEVVEVTSQHTVEQAELKTYVELLGTLPIAQFASICLALVRSVGKSILGFKSLSHLLITPVIIPV